MQKKFRYTDISGVYDNPRFLALRKCFLWQYWVGVAVYSYNKYS